MRSWSWVVVCCCAAMLAGCGGSGGKSKNQVSGSVELDGKPLLEGEMTFVPKGEGRPEGARVSGGAYTAELEDGEYKVKIEATKKVPLGPGEPSVSGEKDKLVSIIPPRYNENTELTITVSGVTKKDFKMTTK